MSDLLREVKLPVEVDFLQLSSYGDRNISAGNVRLLKDLDRDIAGRDVLVIEDIIDSGISANYIQELISKRSPRSLEFAAMLFKKGVSKLNFEIKYFGFKIPDKFFVGYGLDYAHQYRNLKSIYILPLTS